MLNLSLNLLKPRILLMLGLSGTNIAVAMNGAYTPDARMLAQMASSELMSRETELNLANQRLDDFSFIIFIKTLKNNITVKTINLSHTDLPINFSHGIVEVLNTNKTLESLNISDLSHWTYFLNGSLPDALAKNSTLTSLDLSRSKLGESAGQQLACSLKSNQGLVYLNLQGNQLGFKGTKAIFDALKHNKTLKSLNLGHNDVFEQKRLFFTWDRDDRGEAAQELAQGLYANESLTSLNVQDNNFGFIGAAAFAGVLMSGKSRLISLNLSGNELGYVGIEAIGMLLEVNDILTDLDLSRNKLEHESIELLCKSLLENKSLTNLNLSANNLGATGAHVIARFLKTDRTLQCLDISNNEFHEEAGAAIVVALRHNDCLRHLNLEGNFSRACRYAYDNNKRPSDHFTEMLVCTLKTNFCLETTLGPASKNNNHGMNYSVERGLERNQQFNRTRPTIMLFLMAHNISDDGSVLSIIPNDVVGLIIAIVISLT